MDPQQNGYRYFEDQRDTEDSCTDEQTRQQIQTLLKPGHFEPAQATELSGRCRATLETFRQAETLPYFYFEPADFTVDMPDYLELLGGIRLLLIEARLKAGNGELPSAAADIVIAWHLSEKVKRLNNQLISYMIGIVSQDDVLKTLQGLISEFSFSREDLARLIRTLNASPDFSEAEFRPVMQAELRYFLATTERQVNAPLAERWSYYQKYSAWTPEFDNALDHHLYHATEMMRVLIPRFYIHPNSQLNRWADELQVVSRWSGQYCSELQKVPEKDVQLATPPTWKHLLLPNQAQQELDDQLGVFKSYLIRRCLAYTQRDAVLGMVTLQYLASQPDNRQAPIDPLLQERLETQPIDYMDGNPLRYALGEAGFYSIGANGVDNHGSLRTCYDSRCFSNDDCINNPTFPLNPTACVVDKEDTDPPGKNNNCQPTP